MLPPVVDPDPSMCSSSVMRCTSIGGFSCCRASTPAVQATSPSARAVNGSSAKRRMSLPFVVPIPAPEKSLDARLPRQ